MKKWLFPLACSLISIIAFILSGILGVLGNGDGTGYGGVVILLCGFIVYCVIVIPIMCTVYSKRCLSGQRFRFLFTLYQSFLITSPYLICFMKDNETIVYSFILFVWCELWGLVGLVRLKYEKTTLIN